MNVYAAVISLSVQPSLHILIQFQPIFQPIWQVDLGVSKYENQKKRQEIYYSL